MCFQKTVVKAAAITDPMPFLVKGHAGHPENERCDELARACASGSSLPRDPGFSSACL